MYGFVSGTGRKRSAALSVCFYCEGCSLPRGQTSLHIKLSKTWQHPEVFSLYEKLTVIFQLQQCHRAI